MQDAATILRGKGGGGWKGCAGLVPENFKEWQRGEAQNRHYC